MKIKNEKIANKTQEKKSLVTHPKRFGVMTKRGDGKKIIQNCGMKLRERNGSMKIKNEKIANKT